MIVVKIELWKHGNENNKVELGRMYLANNMTGTKTHGNYNAATTRKGEERPPWSLGKVSQPTRVGEVVGYPRKSKSPWVLVQMALAALFPKGA